MTRGAQSDDIRLGLFFARSMPGTSAAGSHSGASLMATSTGESLEKLEDMIVRAAETTAANVRAAKEAIGAVIFGQDKVIEQALITVLCGSHALLIGLPGIGKTKLIDTMGTVLGLDARRIQFI